FVAVGSSRDRLGVVELGFAAELLGWAVEHFDRTPSQLNLLNPVSPTKHELVERLRRRNPDLRLVWLPRAFLYPLSWLAVGIQKLLRPKRPALDLSRIFRTERLDTSRIASLKGEIRAGGVQAG
ncbi:MAG: hypothetical protein C4290_10290, partial [Chloroflexota bacterium]